MSHELGPTSSASPRGREQREARLTLMEAHRISHTIADEGLAGAPALTHALIRPKLAEDT